VVDNREELARIGDLSARLNKRISIAFRLKPGIEAHTHDFVQTGKIDSKFGVAIPGGDAMDIVKTALRMKGVSVDGIHCHIGSQIFDLAPFDTAAKIMLGFIHDVIVETGHEIGEMNLGGGYGINYIPEHDRVDYGEYMLSISAVVRAQCKEYGMKLPYIVMEPGRSIVASTGITLYTAGSIKKIDDKLTYVLIDGGMTDNPRYALYEAPYDAVVANRAGDLRIAPVTIAGKCCESGDLIGRNIMMQDVKAGDIIAVFATGAYNYSMSSNYNRHPKPPVVMLRDGESRVVVKREDYDDIIRNDL
jgi:diaminopimelate decarboxylase